MTHLDHEGTHACVLTHASSRLEAETLVAELAELGVEASFASDPCGWALAVRRADRDLAAAVCGLAVAPTDRSRPGWLAIAAVTIAAMALCLSLGDDAAPDFGERCAASPLAASALIVAGTRPLAPSEVA